MATNRLWNAFCSDIRFVGPRALVPNEIEVRGARIAVPIEEIPGDLERHRIIPGLTGIAQIYAPRDNPRSQIQIQPALHSQTAFLAWMSD